MLLVWAVHRHDGATVDSTFDAFGAASFAWLFLVALDFDGGTSCASSRGTDLALLAALFGGCMECRMPFEKVADGESQSMSTVIVKDACVIVCSAEG